eukprot:TRINITY_DN37513_c0_g1_i1.p1 TRINITY_DN37513_c0_g1~~TRINITY_DN37513_c0_g1_i1.p1  ORF type:complete len:279 (+),score=54.82 TRINITY_DN37513_c0_g1_i1:31-837(+)
MGADPADLPKAADDGGYPGGEDGQPRSDAHSVAEDATGEGATAAVSEPGDAGKTEAGEHAPKVNGKPSGDFAVDEIPMRQYKDELDMPGIVELIEKDLSEPYSIFTYRYFINNWPELCFLAEMEGKTVGAIVCKLDVHRSRHTYRGYIAMLAVEKTLRGRGLGSKLVKRCLDQMKSMGSDECVLETEVTNKGALGLYRRTGFVKEKRLHKYYLNGNDAFRLKFLFKLPQGFSEGVGCLGPPADPETAAPPGAAEPSSLDSVPEEETPK